MKRNIILGVLLLSAICVGSMLMRPVSAQKEVLETPVNDAVARPASTAPQTLPFSQNWTTTTLIATDDDWSGVPGIVGYRGDDLSTTIDVDLRTVLVNGSGTPADVNANRSDPDAFTSGGLAEFDGIANPVVAMQGSGTADIPHLVLYLNTTGQNNIQVTYNARDIDNGTGVDAVQQINTQFRVGGTGDYANVTGGYIADASGPGAATLVTPVSVTLPAAANNQSLVEVRIMTTNALGSDEFIGIDDINVTGTAAGTPTPTPRPRFLFTTRLNGANEVPANASTGRGYGRVVLNAAETEITASFYWENLSSGTTIGHIHTGPASGTGPVTFDMVPTPGLTSGSTINRVFPITPEQVATLRAGGMYFNIHTANFNGGEIRGQIVTTLPDPPLDFNGDGKTDFGVIRQTQGGTRFRWFNLLNTPAATESQTDFGIGSDNATPGDFDGDGKDDIAVWRSGSQAYFHILESSTNTVRQVAFGLPNDDPFQIADFDGDGIDDPAVYRPGSSNSAQSYFWWYGSYGVTKNVQVVVAWGVGADQAAPGDYNGDGKADYCVIRTVSNRSNFFIHPGTGGFDAPGADTVTRFGLAADYVVPGDYDGDGATDIAVTRPEGGATVWYYLPSSGGTLVPRTFWGRSNTNGDQEVQGDYDGDGKTDQAIWRTTTTPAAFIVLRSSDGTVQYQAWGSGSTDIPSGYDIHNN